MITINRERTMSHGPDEVWALLSEPANLPRIMPRISRVEVGAATAQGIPLTAHFNLGSQLGHRTAPGIFRAVDGRDVSYQATKPMPILARWLLEPVGEGTLVRATLEFNLKPVLGPLAMMAPMAMIKKNVTGELDLALQRTAQLLRDQASQSGQA
ncbi:MAG TPA: SRPBCC family protein [Herpetosiphonaceae bacterium]|nr:SRPBCC family protein [Herpetosiphonaceae bacterium]